MIKEYIKNNKLHILIIIIGTILLLIPAFHSNIWFDESYSVGIINHSFIDIWKIGGNDVHPILYYWLLKAISIIFGKNIIIYRLFSVLGIVTMGILGLTHIKKDFDKKTGLLFSFFSFFLPTMLNYALEIRMYSWAIVFVTLMVIYLNRFIKYKNTKNLILFGIFSLASCYMHYYALMCAGIINLGLIIYIAKNKEKFDKNIIKKFIITEIVQVLLYLPWLIYFVIQLVRVSAGFWISLEYPQIFIDILDFQFKGSLNQTIPLILSICVYAYIIYMIIKSLKNKENMKQGIIPIALYFIVTLCAFIISQITPILVPRYLFTITGLLIFSISYFLAKDKNKYITAIICGIILVMSVVNCYKNVQENYDESNGKQIEYLEENLKEDDIIIYKNIINGGVIAAQVQTNKQYFLNLEYWSIEEAYKAYAPQLEIEYTYSDVLEKANGRIFIIDTAENDLYNDFPNKEEYNKIDEKKFETKFKSYTYNIIILEKNK